MNLELFPVRAFFSFHNHATSNRPLCILQYLYYVHESILATLYNTSRRDRSKSPSAGILEQSLGARNRVGLGLSCYIGWRNKFLGIDSSAPYKFKNTVSE
jgi:hypothetical protein